MTQPTGIGRALALLSRIEPLRVLDAYSCIGGGTEGYRRAFENCQITGVDIQAQPDYRGDAFHQGDAIEFIRAHGVITKYFNKYTKRDELQIVVTMPGQIEREVPPPAAKDMPSESGPEAQEQSDSPGDPALESSAPAPVEVPAEPAPAEPQPATPAASPTAPPGAAN